ncbi:MAG: DUF58 domain-containing protein [Desulfurococcaceae archaeon]
MKIVKLRRGNAILRPSKGLYLAILVTSLPTLLFLVTGSRTLENIALLTSISLLALTTTSYSIIRSFLPLDRVMRARFYEPLICLVGDSVMFEVFAERDVSSYVKIGSARLLSDKGMWLKGFEVVEDRGNLSMKCYVTGYVGGHKALGIELVVRDPLRFFNLLLELFFESAVDVYIAPRRAVSAFTVEKVLSKYAVFEAPVTRRRGMGVDVLWVREYIVGDDFRKIAWKATAKTSRLMVKEYEAKTYKNILVIASIHSGFFHGDPPPLDTLARMILDLVHSGLEKGLKVRIGIATEKGVKVTPVLSGLRIEDVYRVFSLIEWPMETGPYSPYPSSNRIIPWLVKVLVRDFCREPCIIALFMDPIDELDVHNITKLEREVRVMRHKLKVYITIPAILRFVYSAKPDFRDLDFIYRRSPLKLFYEYY